MTTAALAPAPILIARPRLATGPFVRVATADFLAMCSFYALLAVVPQYAAGMAGGSLAAGLTMGVLTFASVLTELAMPRLTRRIDHRWSLAAGLLMLGLPSLLLPAAHGLAAVLAVCALRGVGFAVVVVAVGALLASVVPPERRGEGMGVMGVVCMLPAVGALPCGVWLVGEVGFGATFVLAAVPATAAAVLTLGLPRADGGNGEALGIWAGLRHPALAGPTTLFCATCVASGVVVTFLTAAVADRRVAVVALAAQSLVTIATRWVTGRYADRRGSAGHLLAPGVLLTAVGLGVAAFGGVPFAVVGGLVVLGVGFGVAQSASMHTMLGRVEPAAYGTVSAVWNLAFDLGWGVGSVAVGVLVGAVGYGPAFMLTAVAVALVAVRSVTRA